RTSRVGTRGRGGAGRVRFPCVPPRRRAFLEGLRDVLPMLLGAGPFGLIAGVGAVGAGMRPFDIVLMSGLVFAGASRLAAISLMASGAAVWAVLLTVAMVNLRHVMYGLALAPWPQRYGVLSRLLVSRSEERRVGKG